MKRFFVWIILGLCLVVLTCSEKITDPDENKPPTRTPFDIAYTTDPSLAASARITAAAGGSLTATDKDGVEFGLGIPPGALKSDTIITITPFSFLRIGGPGGNSCPACAGTDSLCCYRGALFEPSGLVLDSAAVLTVQLPSGMAFPFPHGGLIVYLDSANKTYQPCFTTYDTTAGTLQAEITHFSGYGTDDERYDRLEEEIYQAGDKLSSDVGTDFFYMDFYPLKMLHMVCNSCAQPDLPLNACYPDLVATIENIVYDAYTRHARIIEQRSFEQQPCDALGSLYDCFMNLRNFSDFGNYGDFSSINIALRSDYVALVYKTGNEGHRLCEADSCDAGMALLTCAHEAIRLSTYSEINFDESFCASVNNWMVNCQCGIDVSIFADKDVVHDIALSAADAENCLVRFSAGVHNNRTNEPVEGAIVYFSELLLPVGTRDIGSCRTGSDGHCERICAAHDLGDDCTIKGISRVYANAVVNSKSYRSDTVSVIVKPLRIATSIQFDYHHKIEGIEGYMEEATGSITGTATDPPCGGAWEDGFLRSWSSAYEYPFEQKSSVGRLISPPLISVPIAEAFADSFVTAPGTSVTVPILTRVYVHMGALQGLVAVEFSGSSGGTAYCDTLFKNVFGCGHLYFCTPVRDIYPPFIFVNGASEPSYMAWDVPSGTTATQTVTVEPVF